MTHLKFLQYYLAVFICFLLGKKAPGKVIYSFEIAGGVRRTLTLNQLLKYNIPLKHLKDYIEVQHNGSIDSLPKVIQDLLNDCQYEGTVRGWELSQFIDGNRSLSQSQSLLFLLLVDQDCITIYAMVHS